MGTKQQGNTGDPIPSGSIPIPPRIPGCLLNGNPNASLFNAPPFPLNSYFPTYPRTNNFNSFSSSPVSTSVGNGIHQRHNTEPHFVFLPNTNRPFNHDQSIQRQTMNVDKRELEALVTAKVMEHINSKK